MDASRLLSVLNDIESEFENGLTRLLTTLVQQYTTARDSPTVDNAPTIQKTFASLLEFIDNGRFTNYPPSKTGILRAIEGDAFVGPGLKGRLNTLLSVAGQTTAGIVSALTALQADVTTFKKSCAQTKAGLEALGLSPHSISPGAFEVGVLIPETLVDHKLSSLVKELGTWNKILRGFQEVAGEEEREVTVVGLASGSYEAYIPLGLLAASYLSRTIDKVLEWYSKVLEIRKHRLELKELGAPTAETSAIQKHEKDLIEKGIEALAKEIVKEAHPKVDQTRKHELETHLTISIRQITRFVDRGGNVEVASTPPKIAEQPATVGDEATSEEKKDYDRLLDEYKKLNLQAQKVNEIIRSGSALRQLPARPEPILQIEMDSDEDTTAIEKHPKRKAEKSS
ncbi:MAG: hypothetical protein E8D44_02485 [Nitrospira sp.]|nr:MAG: hypothetical protein E8D44_02485 [Nitrospira sp.]